jgi:signal transduction histidine kinase
MYINPYAILPFVVGRTHDTGHKTQDTRHMAQDTGHKTQDTRPTSADPGSSDFNQRSSGSHLRSSISPSVIITIKDTGKGIDPKDLPHIFDPFFSKKDHGTGLGLSITHEIVKGHNGVLSVESKPGEGAAFVLEFPLKMMITDKTQIITDKSTSDH